MTSVLCRWTCLTPTLIALSGQSCICVCVYEFHSLGFTHISFPHPFISLLTPTKGKRLLPRLLRHLSPSQTLTIFTLLLACFTQLDVVWNAPPPLPPHTKDEERREKETDVFLGAVVPAFLSVLDRCELRMVAGMVGLVAERCDVLALARTRVRLDSSFPMVFDYQIARPYRLLPTYHAKPPCFLGC